MKLRTAALVPAAAILTWLSACGLDVEAPTPLAVKSGSTPYQAAISCKECHPNEWSSWNSSNHAHAEKNLDDEVLVTATGPDGGQHEFVGVRKIGVEPLVQYLIEVDGNLQVAQRAFDPVQEDWFDIFEDGRGPGEWGHWTGRGMNWDSMCARCHNTNYEKVWDPSADIYQSTFDELGVACEACHPNASQHAQNPEKVRIAKARDQTAACAPCHSRRAELGAISNFGDKGSEHPIFLDNYSPELPDLSDTWLADGRIRDENYEWASFRLSRLHSAGVSCIDCHDPHSSKTKLPGDALCMSCHNVKQGTIPVLDIANHSHHQEDSEGARCVSCHMPTTTYMQRDPRHDHSFSVPDPQLSKELGLRNACNDCHQDQTIDWAIEHVDSWYGEKMERPRRTRARFLDRARQVNNGDVNDPEAWRELLDWLKQEKHPMWRAVLTNAISAWPSGEGVFPYLLNALRDEEPLVRLAVVRALGPELAFIYSAPNRGVDYFDPYRAIRVEAGLALGELLKPESNLNSELNEFFKHNRDQPQGAASYSTWLADRNQYAASLSELERALTWDNSQPILHEALVAALDAAGKSDEAAERSEYITKRWPDYAEGWFLFALAKGAKQEWYEAERALGKCIQLSPEFARAWFNLAIVRIEQGNQAAAKSAAKKAAELDPRDPQIEQLLLSLGITK